MSSIVWNRLNLENLLGSKFLNCVLNNMGRKESKVRFGITGNGIQPNYQITDLNGFIVAYSGKSHKKRNIDEFSEKNLSDVFDRDVIAQICHSIR